MKSLTKPGLRGDVSLLVEDGKFTFSVQSLSVCSGPCLTKQEAFSAVFGAIQEWEASITSETVALTPSLPLAPCPGREVGNGAGAPILRRLLDKFGMMTNRQLKDRLGLDEVNLTVFSNALAGRGSRLARVMIAYGLNEPPSKLWPSLSEKTRTTDDEVFSLLSLTVADRDFRGRENLGGQP
jgi:hypothetical protein